MDPVTNFSAFDERLKATTTQVTRTANNLAGQDLNFHRTSSSEFGESLDEESGRILSLTNSLLKAATKGTDVRAPVLHNEESIDDNWHDVVDVIDALLERADACFDEFTGIIKKLNPSQQERGQGGGNSTAGAAGAAAKKPAARFPTIYDYGPSKIPKPQLQFARAADTTDASPFRPLLRTKPHAIVPLEKSLEADDALAGGYRNPYETEIRDAKYPSSTYAVSDPIPYLPFESTSATFVDSMEGVMEMLEELKAANEIAIDLEHHDVHSYHGLVSLMQISTREKDWVVDTLRPWREKLQVLNEVFADPNILKVLHGASMDIIWLQRDLGLYVVGMFDTYHAACALNYPKRSLKFLLQKFVNFEADKRYQIADWRLRPLPEGMFDYARSDTHYLLHIFDHLRNELVRQSSPEYNLIDYVLDHSKTEALQRYERPVYDAVTGQGAGGWFDYLSRNSAVLSKEQFAVFRAVHQWRDEVARAEDEGVQCVFPKHVLFKLAHVMPLDMGTLFRTLSPVTPITKSRSGQLLEVIKQAKLAGADGPEWRDFAKPSSKQAGAGLLTPPATDYPAVERFEVSQFWGGVLDVQDPPTPPEYSAAASAEALRISLPLPPMPKAVSEVKPAPSQPELSQPAAPAPAPAPVVEKPDPEEDVSKPFTVKELGGPRKRKAEAPAPSRPEEEDILPLNGPIDEESTMDQESKQALKRQRRKEKKKNKAPNNGGSGGTEERGGNGDDDAMPFNYEAAESVLHANPGRSAAGPGKLGQGRSKKPYNPYAKAAEAPSAARKGKQMTSGKTLTFR